MGSKSNIINRAVSIFLIVIFLNFGKVNVHKNAKKKKKKMEQASVQPSLLKHIVTQLILVSFKSFSLGNLSQFLVTVCL